MFELAKTPLGKFVVGIAFGKLTKLLPVKRVSQNKYYLAFYHPKPSYKIHILIIPKKGIRNLQFIDEKNEIYITECIKAVGKIAKDLKLEKDGYRLIANGGKHQEIPQLHFHLISQ